jgi:hypothetical protein
MKVSITGVEAYGAGSGEHTMETHLARSGVVCLLPEPHQRASFRRKTVCLCLKEVARPTLRE